MWPSSRGSWGPEDSFRGPERTRLSEARVYTHRGEEGRRSDIVRGPRPSTISEQLASGSSQAQARPTPSSASAVRARKQQTTGDRGCGPVGSTTDPFQLRKKKPTQVSFEGCCEVNKQGRGQLGGLVSQAVPQPLPMPLPTASSGLDERPVASTRSSHDAPRRQQWLPFCNPSYRSATAARMWCQAHRTSSGGL